MKVARSPSLPEGNWHTLNCTFHICEISSKQTKPKTAWVILQSFNRKKTGKEILSFPVCFMTDTNIFPSGSTAWRKLRGIIIWSFWRKPCPKLCSHYAETWLVWWRMGIFVVKSVHIRQNIGRFRVHTWLFWAWLKKTREVVSIMIRPKHVQHGGFMRRGGLCRNGATNQNSASPWEIAKTQSKRKCHFVKRCIALLPWRA